MKIKTNAVLCDSIHAVENGKFILVGVVTGSIQTNASEFSADFSLHATFNGIPSGRHTIDIRLTTPDNTASTARSNIEIAGDVSFFTLNIDEIPFKTSKSGRFRIDWKLDASSKWTTLIELGIELELPLGTRPFDFRRSV